MFCAALTLMVMSANANLDAAANLEFITEQKALPADLRECENDGATITGTKTAKGTEAFKRARLRIPKSG